MSVYYVDLENGNDGNDGSSWAQAFATLTQASTTASNFDEIYIAKTPDPTFVCSGEVQANNYVQLDDFVTLDVTDCESTDGWSVSNNMNSPSLSTSRQLLKNNSIIIRAQSSFTTGLMQWYTLPSGLNLDDWYALNFIWASTTTSNYNISVALCSGENGDGFLHEFILPKINSSYSCYFMRFDDNWNALTSGELVRSIAFSAGLDPGTSTFYVDDIFFSKHKDDDACIDLFTTVALSSGNVIGPLDTEWWGAVGTVWEKDVGIIMGGTSRSSWTDSDIYPFLTNDRVRIYRRNAFTYGDYVGSTSDQETLSQLYTYYKGGFNTDTNEQDGLTAIQGDGLYMGYWLNCTSNNMEFENFITQRWNRIQNFTSSIRNNYTWKNTSWSSASYGFAHNTFKKFTVEDFSLNGLNSFMSLSSMDPGELFKMTGKCIWQNFNFGISSFPAILPLEVSGEIVIRNSTPYAFPFIGTNNPTIYGLEIESTSIGFAAPFVATFKNCKFSTDDFGGSEASLNSLCTGAIFDNCQFGNRDLFSSSARYQYNPQTANTINCTGLENRAGDELVPSGTILGSNFRVFPQTTTRHTESGFALAFAFNDYEASNSTYSGSTFVMSEDSPIKIKLAEVAVRSNSQVTISVWVKKPHATATACKIICPGGQLEGVDSDVEDVALDTTDWQELTINFTPTDQGVFTLYIYFWVTQYYSSTSPKFYIDDLEINQS